MATQSRLRTVIVTAVSFGGLLLAASVLAQPALPDEPQIVATQTGPVRVVPIKGLTYPWALAFLPDGDLLVTEQNTSALRRISNDALDPTPIIGLPAPITSQRRDTAGVDVTVHPRFEDNGLVYVSFWTPKPDDPRVQTAVIHRGRLDGHRLVDTEQIFESVSWTDGPSAIRAIFGPDDKLFVAIGAPGFGTVAGETGWAQDPQHHGGKLLRLNDDGSIPDDNPFLNEPGHLPELYVLGIRNAIGMAFHPETGQLWETENGPQGGDEVNVIRPGLNYGWPVVTYGRAYSSDPEGARSGLPPPTVQPPTSAPGMEEPFLYYTPSIAIAGMAFYTGDQFPEWTGDLFVGGLIGRQVSRIQFNANNLERRRETLFATLGQRIRDVKQGPDGYLYLTTDMQDGAVLRIEPAP
ncbi:MAG: hypothetical protein CL483_13295 [Acidobacteria bacterium]|nr:hypothetical protein [Acidobacteriota bacterium]